MVEPLSLIMTTDAVGGVWRYSIDLCRELQRFGVRIRLVCLGPAPSAEQRAEARGVPDLTLLEHPEPLEWMDEPWDGVDRSGRYLRALAAEVSADVVHLNGYCHGAAELQAPTVVVGHSCVLSWWEAVEAGPAPARLATYRSRVSRGLRRASAVVAPSQAMLGSLQRHYGLRGGRVIWNGSPGPSTSAGARVAKQPLILCAARLWDRAKNVATLAEAASGCVWKVLVAGAGDAPASVHALGSLARTELSEWMQRASIYAHPARYEPFGLSVLEAARAGCALVLGDIPSLREIWGADAIYVPPGDARALRDALNRLAEDAPLCAAWADRAKRRAERYTSEEQARRYLQLYLKLARSRASSGRASRAFISAG